MAGNYGSLIKAIASQFASTTAFNGVSLYFGRNDPSVKTFPRANYFDVTGDAPGYGYDATKYVTASTIQFDFWDVDPDNVSTLVEAAHTAYHRQALTLDTGVLCTALRLSSQVMIDPGETTDTSAVYHGVVRVHFTVDTP